MKPILPLTQEFNFAACVLQVLRKHPALPAVENEERIRTFGSLYSITIMIAIHMHSRGVGRSSCVGFDLHNTVFAIASTMAIALLGAKCIQYPGPAVLKQARVTHLLVDGDGKYGRESGVMKIDSSWTKLPDHLQPGTQIKFPGYESPDDVCMLISTSGSTGGRKLVPLTYRQAFYRIFHTNIHCLGSSQTVFSLFENKRFSTIFRYMAALYLGRKIYAPFNKEHFFELPYEVDLLQASPSQIQSILSKGLNIKLQIKSIELSGSLVTSSFLQECFKLSPKIFNLYGAIESGGICYSEFDQARYQFGYCGSALEKVKIEIVDSSGRSVPFGQEGVIRTKSPGSAQEYLGETEASAKSFRNGWFYSGDVGFLTEKNELVLAGRSDDRINLGGVKINGAKLNAKLQSIENVNDAMWFIETDSSISDKLSVLASCQHAYDESRMVRSIEEVISEEKVPSHNRGKIYLVANVPRNANGKLMRDSAILAAKEAHSVFRLDPKINHGTRDEAESRR